MTTEQLVAGRIDAILGTPTPDSVVGELPIRLNAYGEVATREAGQHGLAEEGSLYVATNPTISTGQTWVAAQTAYSATAPNFFMLNDEAAGGKSIRLHSLKMISTAAATGTTAIHYAAILDPTLRGITTNNMLAITPKNLNGGISSTVAMRLWAQNSATVSALAAASSNARIVARGCLGGLNIAGEEFQIIFGGTSAGSIGQTAVNGAGQPGLRVTNAPAIVVAPQQSLAIMIWAVGSSAAPDPEFELVFAMK